MRVRACACVCVRECGCVRACVRVHTPARVCLRVCVRLRLRVRARAYAASQPGSLTAVEALARDDVVDARVQRLQLRRVLRRHASLCRDQRAGTEPAIHSGPVLLPIMCYS